ncbi:MAG: beta-ketoacyl-[acyl-carrier-protein] synthase family protein, partial [Desulfuromonadales bacterium]|nr:beta-ketoacyl-[acyl-carrier-protein] synthase family protein [Desulfuromonadales bacterium]
MKERIAITGLGVFSGAAKNIKEYSAAIIEGKSNAGEVDLFDVSCFQGKIAVQVKGYKPEDYFDRPGIKKLSRADQFAVLAAREALAGQELKKQYDPYSIGVVVGAGAAGMLQAEEWLKKNLLKEPAKPDLLRGSLPDSTSTILAKTFEIGGYQGTVTTACSSSSTAIGLGADLIATNKLDAVLCGGTDSLSILTFAGFNSLKVIDPKPCSPFSAGRQGITLGEGAAFTLLEKESKALERGATIYGYVLGYAIAGEAYHMTAPEPTGEIAASLMQKA